MCDRLWMFSIRTIRAVIQMKQLPNILTLSKSVLRRTGRYLYILHAPQYIAEFNGVEYTITNPEPVYWASAMVVLAGFI